MITELQNHIEPCLDYCALTDIWKASVKATHDFVSADDIEFYSDRIPRTCHKWICMRSETATGNGALSSG